MKGKVERKGEKNSDLVGEREKEAAGNTYITPIKWLNRCNMGHILYPWQNWTPTLSKLVTQSQVPAHAKIGYPCVCKWLLM